MFDTERPGSVPGSTTPVPDAAVPDAAVPDAAVPDAAVPDAAVPDAAVPDAPASVRGDPAPVPLERLEEQIGSIRERMAA
jgi:hypothetical protein